MDEFSVVLRAREFVHKAGTPILPPSMEGYLRAVGGVLRREHDMEPGEAGSAFEADGKYYVCVNAEDSDERQRFTICHEIAHKVLGLPSDHATQWWSYAKRPPNEVLCDVFAAELLLPHQLFEPLAEKARITFAAIEELGASFVASITSTGSRFAMVLSAPCAFVLSEQGVVRYASRSKTLRDAGAWIPPRLSVPSASVSARIRSGGRCEAAEEIAADLWFNEWRRGGVLLEEARYLRPWDQTLTLLWFEDEEVPGPVREDGEQEEEPLLRELDGSLPWPGKKRRR